MEASKTKVLSLGTNRLVIIGKDYVYKLPIGKFGKLANKQEYQYSKIRDYIALTEQRWYGLKQERLSNIIILPLDCKDIPQELNELYKKKLTNRFQVGQDKTKKWKFFDYEDVKYYVK